MSADNFARYLKKLRIQKGLRVTKLGQLSGVSPSYISQVENGGRSVPLPNILTRLAPHLGIGNYEILVKAGYIDPAVDPVILDDDSIRFVIASLTEEKKNLMRTLEHIDDETIASIDNMIKSIKRSSQERG